MGPHKRESSRAPRSDSLSQWERDRVGGVRVGVEKKRQCRRLQQKAVGTGGVSAYMRLVDQGQLLAPEEVQGREAAGY